ncbi:MAG: hypothetical protein IJO10_10125 [Clostridia bacterium]|nr:hypothetical protein [Clostridia bacterium]
MLPMILFRPNITHTSNGKGYAVAMKKRSFAAAKPLQMPGFLENIDQRLAPWRCQIRKYCDRRKTMKKISAFPGHRAITCPALILSLTGGECKPLPAFCVAI